MSEITPESRPILETDISPYYIDSLYSVILINSETEDKDIYMPDASLYLDMSLTFKNISSHLGKVHPTNEPIDDSMDIREIAPLGILKVCSDGLKWWIV